MFLGTPCILTICQIWIVLPYTVIGIMLTKWNVLIKCSSQVMKKHFIIIIVIFIWKCNWSLVINVCTAEYPPEVVDASIGMAADAAKKKMEEAAMIIKTTYWSVIVIVAWYRGWHWVTLIDLCHRTQSTDKMDAVKSLVNSCRRVLTICECVLLQSSAKHRQTAL